MQPLIGDASKLKLQLNLKLAKKELQPLLVAASKHKLPIKLKLAVKIYKKTSEVQGKLFNNEKYFTRNAEICRPLPGERVGASKRLKKKWQIIQSCRQWTLVRRSDLPIETCPGDRS
ncbi:hypothetical protein AVEN_58725-1 [Araneus ventricosus]|uniref:Uncharacterized protein n=1 Tax=Araneus ventricosus TaxID=182803 RepID=A0A4Y2RE05_ARAVE|nr:hypothetical protein AVEN_58725-1 [Araneus ventricosus]